MMDRAEFNHSAEVILDFVDTYGMLKNGYLKKFFPNDKKVINYLITHKRLSKSSDGAYITINEETRPDKALLAALGMLSDIFEKVKTHARATPPAQISFITQSGDYYEIIYVAYGMEAMVTASYKTQLFAKKQSKSHVDTTKRMMIVENTDQMERLQIPGIVRFALVQPNGSLTYYKAGS